MVVQLDTAAGPDQGDVDLFNAAGSVNAVVDIEGWFQYRLTGRSPPSPAGELDRCAAVTATSDDCLAVWAGMHSSFHRLALAALARWIRELRSAR